MPNRSRTKPKPSNPKPRPKESVLGIGGLFFRCKDPDALGKWYRDHLGVSLVPETPDDAPWVQEAGPTALSPFPEDADYHGTKWAWMINFRVRDLDAIVAQLAQGGISVTIDPEAYPYGRFAHLADPEGHPIELWEPK